MSASHRRSRAPRATGAFTLIEIVMVIALLAAVAGLAVTSMQGAHEQVTHDLARHELSEVRRAILQFRTDTGFLPKHGIFDLDGRGQGKSKVPSYVPTAEATAWFDDPANLWQLFECPLPSDATQADFHPLSRWDAGRHRGWRGPYLRRDGEGRLKVSSISVPVPAIADPFSHATLAEWFTWESGPTEWATTTEGRSPALASHRAFQFDLSTPAVARLICLGADGESDPSTDPEPDDLITEIAR